MSFGLLKKSEPENVHRRSQESQLRRGIYNLIQPREEEATYYYLRGDKSSQRNQRRLRQEQEEQPISKPKVFSKSYTTNPVAKGKAVDSISKAKCKTRTTSHRPSPYVESADRIKGKAEAVHSRTREVRCFKCQGRGHYANECTNKKTMVLLENGVFETKQEVENSSASEEEAQETKEAEVEIEQKEAEVVPIKNGTVSRTKLFEEEGYDMIMESSEKTHVPCSEQTKSMINFSLPSTTWSTFSPHLEHISKLNQSNPSSGEEVIQLPSQVIPSLRDSDIRAFNNYFQPNPKESSYETNYSGILNHQRIWENWILNNSGSDLGDMNFTSQWIFFRPYCATEPKIMMHSPTQVRSRGKTNWIILLDLLGFQQAQEKKKWILDHKVTAHLPKRVNLVLNLKSSRPDWFVSFQTFVWHPGGIYTKPSKPNKAPERAQIGQKGGEVQRSFQDA